MNRKQRKKPAQRAFTGVAGSPLAIVREFKKGVPARPVRASGQSITLQGRISPEDETLKSPRHLTTPERFDPWVDVYGQPHAQIDLDCAFQDHAFDKYLGRGHSPNVDSGPRKGAHHEPEDVTSALQSLGCDTDDPKPGFRIGTLAGERPFRSRRPGSKDWWVFDDECLESFIKNYFDVGGANEDRYGASRAVYVLYEYYRKSRQDKEICEDSGTFETPNAVKKFRQGLIEKGAARFGTNHTPVRCGKSCWCSRCKARAGCVQMESIATGPDRFSSDGKLLKKRAAVAAVDTPIPQNTKEVITSDNTLRPLSEESIEGPDSSTVSPLTP